VSEFKNMLSKRNLKKQCMQAGPISDTDSEHNYMTTGWASGCHPVIPTKF
jgi:hypothetical protein